MSYVSPIKLPVNCPTIEFTTGSLEENLGAKEYAVGGYGEDRADVYEGLATHTGRTVHMGDDIFAPAGTPVLAVADGKILSFTDNAVAGDYGPTMITEHQLISGETVYALYGHLSRESLADKQPGQTVFAGQHIATVGDKTVNGGWAPHVHFQISLVKPEICDMPGVVAPSNFEEAKKTYPSPRSVFGDIY